MISKDNCPPNLWFAFRGLSSPFSLIMNVANIVHDNNEVIRKPIDFINHNWI